MKKILLIFVVTVTLFAPLKTKGQSQEIQQLILNIEKLAQFKKILSDMKKGYEILSGGYNIVKDLSQGNFSLHKTFLDALMQVSPVVKNYKRVGDIVSYQLILVRESKIALNRFVKSDSFTAKEIDYFEKIYSNLTKESLRNLDELITIVTADKLRMSDDERLEAIDKIYLEMQEKVLFLRNFNSSSDVLALQRAKDKNDVNLIRDNYQIKN
ncbi:TerB family tellurite resistance protein [Flavobacterium aquidurense]|uniref:TerB family tellurite resistance protein n=1 Tax=Flavobacterium aquidurense TaxID=362413 RepID=UPI00285CE813|nr:TerB family tellurite resistance protein [Flavobacterium aquidurense]MDR7371047.1 DNA repair ATPase RecN [Flavobacterium aquidurense]